MAFVCVAAQGVHRLQRVMTVASDGSDHCLHRWCDVIAVDIDRRRHDRSVWHSLSGNNEDFCLLLEVAHVARNELHDGVLGERAHPLADRPRGRHINLGPTFAVRVLEGPRVDTQSP